MENGSAFKGPIEDQERAVGITAYAASSVPGFACTIKQRYTDFLVHEILPGGEVVHLTELSSAGSHKRTTRGIVAPSGDSNGHPSDISIASSAGQAAKRKGPQVDHSTEKELAAPRKKVKIDEKNDEKDSRPTKDQEEDPEDARATKKERVNAIVDGVPAENKQALQEIFGANVTDQILHLYAHVVLYPERKSRDQPLVKSDEIPDKSKRTEAHTVIRRIFSSKLESETLQNTPGLMSIRAAHNRAPTGARGRPAIGDDGGAMQKGKLGWDQLGGEYLHFTLYKENKDTMEALYYIASRLKVPNKNFQFAGTKDRRAVTTQRVAIYRIHADRLAELNKTARGWRVGNFKYEKTGLQLGELDGNEFLLTLRDCHFVGDNSPGNEQSKSLARSVLANATMSLRERGFINYYGLQRFGSYGIGTHVTGRKILSGDLEGAINTILHVSPELALREVADSSSNKIPQDDIDRAQAITLWQAGKGKEASRKMPKRFQAEAALVEFLSKRDRKTGELLHHHDWQNALTGIPRNLRMIYVHAYQSFVWNTMASKRWEMFGSKVAEGDLVIIGEKDGTGAPAPDEVDEDGEPVFHPAAGDTAPSMDEAYARARHLSNAEAESGQYDIFDIVLPQPGFDVLYPANAIGKAYEDFMASDAGGGIDPHNMRRSWKDISLSGAYRKLLARPGKAMDFEVKSYIEDTEQMVETDLERLERAAHDQNGHADATDHSSEAKKVAVVLKLQLGTSQYATMALRELTKGGAGSFTPDFSSR